MKEAYVTFDTAELLKEKNFDWECRSYYEYFSSDVTMFQGMLPELSEAAFNFNNKGSDICSMPTQQMACRWLREEKNIDIVPFHEQLPNDCYWCRIERNLYTAYTQEPIYSTYEDAVEAALQYCLTNLI